MGATVSRCTSKLAVSGIEIGTEIGAPGSVLRSQGKAQRVVDNRPRD